MANTQTIQFKRSSVPGKIPSANAISIGELALNLNDKIIYSKDTTGNIISFTDPSTATIASLAFEKANSAYTVANQSIIFGNTEVFLGQTKNEIIGLNSLESNSIILKGNSGYIEFTTTELANTIHFIFPDIIPNNNSVLLSNNDGNLFWADFSGVGYVGSKGYTGSQGNIGYTGSIGTTGYTGSQGNIRLQL
jgi:hypothetical protein